MVNSDLSGAYLTFRLDKETFAVSVRKVREVLEYAPITKVPRTPDHMLGVINLRGAVVPVMDLGIKFGLGPRSVDDDTGIVVMEVKVEDETVVLGAVVDGVEEVLELEAGEIQPPPPMGARMDSQFLLGLGQRDTRFLMLLDMDRIFSAGDVVRLKEQV